MRQWSGDGEEPVAGAEIPRPPVHRITLAQLAALALLSLIALAFSSVGAYSLFCGGLIAIVPQAYFAGLVFRRRGAGSARAITRASYIGEAGKFLLSVAGFVMVFAAVRPISGPLVFGGYIAMLALQVFGGWWLLRRPPRRVDSYKSVE